MSIRTLLVDDEQPARDRLRRLLADFPDVEVVGEAADGVEAVEEIDRRRPDLVFLDVQMPGRSGLEVAAELRPPRPAIVFCTAFDQYAIDAFELHALDYLLKPAGRARLARSLERVRSSLRDGRLRSEDLAAAGDVQRRLLPSRGDGLPTLDVSGSCRPASEVGGDYFDFIPVGPGRLGVVVADVAGKGVQAALLMAGLQGRLQSLAPEAGEEVATLAARLNRRLWETTADARYATLFYAVYDDRRRSLGYVNAGHQPPLLFRPDASRPERLEAGGTALGLFPEWEFSRERLELEPGDVIVLYTDGVIEAVNPAGEEFGAERWANRARPLQNESARDLQARLQREVREFCGDAPQADDVTIAVMAVREPSATPGDGRRD